MTLFKILPLVFLGLFISGMLLQSQEKNSAKFPPNTIESVNVKRCDTNPLIEFKSSATLGDNINGPSVIRVPAWVKSPLGKYYMYFAHHHGQYIRLAYANTLSGPWQVYEKGTLQLNKVNGFYGHIASPDIIIDEDKQEIRMYFHGPAKNAEKGAQKTGFATSKDGIDFSPSETILGDCYFRVFRWKDYFYAIDRSGMLSRSKDGITAFENRSNLIKKVRHSAIMINGDQLLVFYSRVGDSPERIVVTTVALKDDWNEWVASNPLDVIKPEKDYEGVNYPNKPSLFGQQTKVQQLRDPCIFQEDNKIYLFYSLAGEMGIAMAEIELLMKDKNEPTVKK